MSKWSFLAALAAATCALACASLAPSRARANATYEWQRTQRLLAAEGLEPAGLPEGKRIAFIRVVRDEVFVADEVWPSWFNWFHRVTRDDVVRRELLFREGEAFQELRSEESMRNLRNMAIFALVRIVPVKVEGDPDAVGVVVHTRDLWSLRLESSFNITTQVDELGLNLSERNFLGRNKVLTGAFKMIPKSFSLSGLYAARRVWGSNVRLSESAGIVFNRDHMRPEGSLWLLKLDTPYYNLAQRFAWVANFSYDNIVARRLQKSALRTYPETPAPDSPFANRVWRQHVLLASLAGSARFGERTKHAFALGWDGRSVVVKPNAETALPLELAEAFRRDVLPRQRREIGPTFAYEFFTPWYHTFENLGTFGQSENVRVGPQATLTLRAPLEVFGSNSNSLFVTGMIGTVQELHGWLMEARLSGRTRFERETQNDQRVDALLRGATPVLLRTFRVVARVALEARRRDTARTYVTLGASNGLRGYTSQKIFGYGESRFLANLELRTLPLEWQAVHVGGVLFYDVGSVFADRDDFKAFHAVGVGLRVLFPQFNRRPFSFDAGTSYDPSFRFVPTITSEQVVPLTAAEDPE
ncbi:MAG: BamA/TamA family outer membrane protein [Polyangiales bacterium]